MVDDEGRNWFMEMLKVNHYSSKQADIIKDKIITTIDQIILNHGFCTSLLDIEDEYIMNSTINIGDEIKRMINEEKYKASQLYFPEHLERFAENYIDNFDHSICYNKRDCNEMLSHELYTVLNSEFDYG